ncbi:MAG TPA: high-potential iron-sulfur protein [Stellaceae bacterium]|nr:high-potential iron-sulfur protein [Stellaceae bacterium]
MAKHENIGRRHLIAAAGAGLLMLNAAARAQQSQEKLGKSDAAYQDSPKNDQQCSECTKFQPPKGCSVVAGDISPKGWCKLYEAPPE